MRFYKYLFYFIFSVLFFSCKDHLPKPTHKGKNKLACVIDGKVWKRKHQFDLLDSYVGPEAMVQNDIVEITAEKDGEYIRMTIYQFKGLGQYVLGDIPAAGAQQNDAYFLINNISARVDSSLHTGIIDITYYNTDKKIIAGTFKFNAVDDNNNDHFVTEGRFDIEYNK